MTAAATFDRASQHRRSLLAKVHLAAKALGLAGDDYQAVLMRVVGRPSAGDCDEHELARLVAEFGRLGWRATPARGAGRPRAADHAVARKARAMWISLHQLGAVRDPSERALEAFARQQLGTEAFQWADQAKGYKLIEALKAMAERAGWSQDLTGIAGGDRRLRTIKRRLVERLHAMLVESGLVPRDWRPDVAAARLGGIRVDQSPAFWTLSDMDAMARLFAAKRREAGL